MKSVDWTKWSAVAEILSAIAIVLTLLYLADQTRQLRVQTEQNNDLLEAQAGYALSQNQASNNALLRSSPEFAEFLAKLASGDPLSPAEQFRETGFYQFFLVNWQWEFREYQSGRLREDQLPLGFWRALMHGEGPLPTPGFLDHWDSLKLNFDPDFVAYVQTNVIQDR